MPEPTVHVAPVGNPNEFPSPLDLPPHATAQGVLQQPMSPEQARHILESMPGGPRGTDCLEWTNFASALYITGEDVRALSAAQTAIALERNSTTLYNLGVCLESHGRFGEALVAFSEGQSMDPNNIAAGAAYSDGLVRLGQWSKGWPLYAIYHSRLATQFTHIPTLSEIAGKRVLITAAGGAGDAIYHLRWLKHLRAAKCDITYAGPESLLSLFKHHLWIDRLLITPGRSPAIRWYTQGEPSHSTDSAYCVNLNEFDVYLSSLSVAAVVNPTPESAWPGVYLHAGRSSWWHPRQRFGICWKAGENRFPRAHRTLTRDQTARILDSLQREWVSLVPDDNKNLRTWHDTARLIATCDLIVTVDTGVAHLAGAMGKTVLVILPTASAWPYGLGDDYKLAYPTMQAFRNRGLGIDNAVKQACDALESLDE